MSFKQDNQVLYSCREAAGNPDQLRLVRSMCQDQEMCWIHVSRQFFGKAECPGTADTEMYLWLVYSCNGGGTDNTTTHIPTCNSTTPPTSTPSTPVSTPPTSTPSTPTSQTSSPPLTGHCPPGDKGELVQEDVPGCDGSLDLDCDEGCIAVHKVTSLVLYHIIAHMVNSGPLQLSKEAQLKFSPAKAGERSVPRSGEMQNNREQEDFWLRGVPRCW